MRRLRRSDRPWSSSTSSVPWSCGSPYGVALQARPVVHLCRPSPEFPFGSLIRSSAFGAVDLAHEPPLYVPPTNARSSTSPWGKASLPVGSPLFPFASYVTSVQWRSTCYY